MIWLGFLLGVLATLAGLFALSGWQQRQPRTFPHRWSCPRGDFEYAAADEMALNAAIGRHLLQAHPESTGERL